MKSILFSIVLSLFIVLFGGCTDDDEPALEGNTPPVANAGPDLTTITGSTVPLNGSASSDADGDELAYLWTIINIPTGSKASILQATLVQTSFVPDIAGTYTLELMVDDGTTTHSDRLLVEVEGEPLETVIVSTDINEPQVWEDIFSNPEIPDYHLTSNIKVKAALTVHPGVVIHLDEKVVLTVESGGGELIAEGEEDMPITFTSANEAGEVRWGGLLVKSSSSRNVLDWTNIHLGGGVDNLLYAGSNRGACVGVHLDGKIKISNTIISRSGQDGLFVMKGGELLSFSDNTFSGNTGFPLSLSINDLGQIEASNLFLEGQQSGSYDKTVRVYDSAMEEDQEWHALSEGSRFLFEGHVKVEANLTIREGTRLEFAEGTELRITENGTIRALGTENKPVIFSGAGVADGQKWAGINIYSSSINNELDWVSVLHAGGGHNIFYADGWKKTAIGLGKNARLKLTNSEISHSADGGIVLHRGANFEAFASNKFHDNGGYPLLMEADVAGMVDEETLFQNNVHDVVAVQASAFTSNSVFSDPANPVWVALQGEASYLILGKLMVQHDLKLAPGAYLAFADEALVEVAANGSLQAAGTPDNKITLTAYQQDGNHNWGGIFYRSANTNNQITHAVVSYGGNADMYIQGWTKANIGLDNNASLQLSNAEVSYSKGYGVAVNRSGTLHTGEGITFSNNALEDVMKR